MIVVSFKFQSLSRFTGQRCKGCRTPEHPHAPASPHPYHTEWGSDPDPHRANSKEEDPTGLLNEGFRYRDLETGTFLTRDPLGFVDGPNVYAYVRQNPWTKFDPQGLFGSYGGGQYSDAYYKSHKLSAAETKFLGGAIQVGAGFVPYVGDAMDAADVVNPNSSGADRAIAGTSLGLNAWTGGLAPNAGPIVKGLKKMGEGFTGMFKGADDVAAESVDAFSGAARSADQAEVAVDAAEATTEAVADLGNVKVETTPSGSATDIKVIGRQEDTAVAADWDGHDVLNDPNWTLEKNDAWVQDGINNKQDFYTASPEAGNLTQTSGKFEGQPTIYKRELNQIDGAGYTKQGDTYVHPDKVKTD